MPSFLHFTSELDLAGRGKKQDVFKCDPSWPFYSSNGMTRTSYQVDAYCIVLHSHVSREIYHLIAVCLTFRNPHRSLSILFCFHFHQDCNLCHATLEDIANSTVLLVCQSESFRQNNLEPPPAPIILTESTLGLLHLILIQESTSATWSRITATGGRYHNLIRPFEALWEHRAPIGTWYKAARPLRLTAKSLRLLDGPARS